MNIQKVQIESLHFDPTNARKHDEKNIKAIAASYAKFGQQKPIVIDGNNVILAGNGSVEAMKMLGWTEVFANKTELTGAEAIAYAVSDNRTAELATWEMETLGSHLEGLQQEAWNLDSLGFDADDLGDFDNLNPPTGIAPTDNSDNSGKVKTCPECGCSL